MNTKYFFLLLFSGSFFSQVVWAQELNFTVTVNTPKIQTADPRVFESLETAVQEFMNNTKWTQDIYEQEERISGNMIININDELSPTRFTAEILMQTTRPIYGSSAETPMLIYQDNNVWFEYEQFQPLIFTQNNFNDNLSSLLAFYAYIALGMDYDSFSPYGGEPYYLRAQEIVTTVPPSIATVEPQGWRSMDGNRNRYWIIENILSPRVRPLRQAMYDYHRQGLDMMHTDVVAARAIMATALEEIGKVSRAYPNAMILQMFSDAKNTEITDIFSAASTTEKNKIIQVMTRVDGSRSAKYRSIR